MRRRTCLAAVLLLIAVATSGCWDRGELQDRGVVTAIALDVAPANPTPEQLNATFTQPHGTKRFLMSYQVLKLEPSEGKTKSKSGPYVLSNLGESLFEMVRDTLGQTSKILYYEHMDTIIISEAVLREISLRELIDYLIREPEFRWRIRIYVTPGEAKPILEYESPTGEPSGELISGIASGQVRNAHLPVGNSDLGYLIAALDNGGDISLPCLTLAGGVLKMGGAAVFRQDRFAGYIDEYMVQGLRLLRGLQKSASIVAESPDYPGQKLALKMLGEKCEVRPVIIDGQLHYVVKIHVWGNIEELLGFKSKEPLSPEQLPGLEAAFRNEIVNNITASVRAVQSVPCDLNGFFGGKVRAYLPDEWEEYQNNWPEVFSKAQFDIQATVTIHNLGDHK
ncbi:MAG TPA: Ger(x)C family spore germination protein [Selenomonadales bacterium]|nr:Ger(x)C family spore germination protein [Selenomonadales bacterium]